MEIRVFKLYGYCALNKIRVKNVVKYCVINKDVNYSIVSIFNEPFLNTSILVLWK